MAPAAQNDSAASNNSDIPLLCTLCDNEPTFTDKSHLLTHISSKGHLAQKQKLELRSRRDPESARMMGVYEAWYYRYGIQELLEERQLAKDIAEEAELRAREARGRKAPKRIRKPQAKVPVDAETNNMVKAEPRGRSQDNEAYSDDHAEHEIPVTKRRSGRVAKATPQYVEQLVPEEAGTPNESVATESELLVEPDLEDKLKGPRYPGMGVFDSASEEQKRKRNQKKDPSVLEAMLRTSATVTRDYHMWDLTSGDMELQRSRDIFATPSVDGSPERDLVEKDSDYKKKRGRKAKASTTASAKASTTAKASASANTSSTKGKAKTAVATKQPKMSSKKTEEDDGTDMDDEAHVQPAAGAARHSHGTRESRRETFTLRPPVVEETRNRTALSKKGPNNQTTAVQAPAKNKSRVTNIDDDRLSFPRRTTIPGNPFSFSRSNPGGNVNPLQIQRPRQANSFSENVGPVALCENFTQGPGPAVSQYRSIPRMPNANMGTVADMSDMGLIQVPTVGQRMPNANMGDGANALNWMQMQAMQGQMQGPAILPQHIARQITGMSRMNALGIIGNDPMPNMNGTIGNGQVGNSNVPTANMGAPNPVTANIVTAMGNADGSNFDLSTLSPDLFADAGITVDESGNLTSVVPHNFDLGGQL